MLEEELELYQVRYKRKAKDILDGREMNLQDCDIRYIVAEGQENAKIRAEETRKAIEYELNTKGHRNKYLVSTVSIRPIHIEGYRIRIEKIVSDKVIKV